MHTGALTFSPRLQRCIAKPWELGRYRSFMRGVMKTLRHILSSPVTDRVLHKFGHITAIIYLGSNVRFNCINSASARDRTLRLVYLWEIVSLLPGMHRNAWRDAIFDARGIRSKPGNALRFFCGDWLFSFAYSSKSLPHKLLAGFRCAVCCRNLDKVP